MTLQVIYELWKPFGGAYTVDTACCLQTDLQGGGGRSLLLGPLPSSKRPLQALEKMVQGLEEARFWAFPGTSSSL